jgi:hypothetical protein
MEREISLELAQFRQRNPQARSEDIARFVEKIAVEVGRKACGDFLNSSNNPLSIHRGQKWSLPESTEEGEFVVDRYCRQVAGFLVRKVEEATGGYLGKTLLSIEERLLDALRGSNEPPHNPFSTRR